MTTRDIIQKRMADHILKVRDLILFCSIRLGKTRIALMAVEPMDRILIVYPDKAIKDSWTAELEKYEPLSKDITFVTKASVHKYANTTWDYLIIDEPQLCQSDKQLSAIKTIKYRKRVGLTGVANQQTLATFEKELNWKVGMTYTIADAIKDKLVKDYEIFIHYVDLDNRQKFPYEKFKKTFYGTEQEIYQYYSDQMDWANDRSITGETSLDRLKGTMIYKKYMGLRTNFLYNSVALLRKASELVERFRNDKVLIYTLRTDIADELSDAVFHSKSKEDDVLAEFKESDSGHLAVVNCVRAGVTIKKLNTVIFHTYESNTEILYQKLGRSLLYEFEGEKSQVHICCLRRTQMEKWIDRACNALEQEKIFYVIGSSIYNKIDWIRINHPDEELYFYNGSVVVRGPNGKGFGDSIIKQYYFLESEDKKLYNLSSNKLIPL